MAGRPMLILRYLNLHVYSLFDIQGSIFQSDLMTIVTSFSRQTECCKQSSKTGYIFDATYHTFSLHLYDPEMDSLQKVSVDCPQSQVWFRFWHCNSCLPMLISTIRDV